MVFIQMLEDWMKLMVQSDVRLYFYLHLYLTELWLSVSASCLIDHHTWAGRGSSEVEMTPVQPDSGDPALKHYIHLIDTFYNRRNKSQMSSGCFQRWELMGGVQVQPENIFSWEPIHALSSSIKSMAANSKILLWAVWASLPVTFCHILCKYHGCKTNFLKGTKLKSFCSVVLWFVSVALWWSYSLKRIHFSSDIRIIKGSQVFPLLGLITAQIRMKCSSPQTCEVVMRRL